MGEKAHDEEETVTVIVVSGHCRAVSWATGRERTGDESWQGGGAW